MKKLTKVLSLLLVFLLTAAIFAGCGSQADGDKKNITLTVVYADKSSEDFKMETTAETLGDAMLEEKLISSEEHRAGFVTTINGVKTDYDADGSWWALFDADGNMTGTGISDLEIKDGDSFKFVYTAG